MEFESTLKILALRAQYFLTEFEAIASLPLGDGCQRSEDHYKDHYKLSDRMPVLRQIYGSQSRILRRIGELYHLDGDSRNAEDYFRKSELCGDLFEGRAVRNPSVRPINFVRVNGNQFIGADGKKFRFGTHSSGPK